jgi:hypothetical protein
VLTGGGKLGTTFRMVAILAHFKCILLEVCMWAGRSILDLAGLVLFLWLFLDDAGLNSYDRASLTLDGPCLDDWGITRLVDVPGYLVQLLEQSHVQSCMRRLHALQIV